MTRKMCIVAGALGIVGRALVDHLEASDEWEVIALSRRKPGAPGRSRHVAVDLLDADDCKARLGEFTGTTHIFYCAYAPRPTPADEVAPNLAMLANLVTTVEKVAPGLAHVLLVQGSKWYGNHLGPYRTPAREDDPRHMPPNFYYDQQDWVQAQQRGKKWTWSAVRPHCICGYSVGSPMNHLMALSLYATLSRELGLPLRFPGSPKAFSALYQFTDARLLARAMAWISSTPACENQAFNITNGEPDRWENLWPGIARCFGMAPGDVQQISLARMMVDKEPLWAAVRRKYGLQDHSLAQLVGWEFADWAYSAAYDQVSSLAKLRRAGWNEVLDAGVMFRELTDGLVRQKVIPPHPATAPTVP